MKDAIHLYNHYYLSNDEYNIIVYKRSIVSKGKYKGSEHFTPIAYHTNVKSLKYGLINQYLIDNIKNINVDGFFEKLDKLLKIINDECNK